MNWVYVAALIAAAIAAKVALSKKGRQRSRLRRGQCENCGTILRDDQRETCSEQCDIEARAHRSW